MFLRNLIYYSEDIIQKALAEATTGIKVNGRIVNIRNAEYIILIGYGLEDIQKLIDQVKSVKNVTSV